MLAKVFGFNLESITCTNLTEYLVKAAEIIKCYSYFRN